MLDSNDDYMSSMSLSPPTYAAAVRRSSRPPIVSYQKERPRHLSSEFNTSKTVQAALYKKAMSGKWHFYFDSTGRGLYLWTHQKGKKTGVLKNRIILDDNASSIKADCDNDPYSVRLTKGQEDRIVSERKCQTDLIK